MQRSILLTLALLGSFQISAQLYIPDLNLRNWLNEAKPNSVDVGGYCDTVAWNAQPPAQVICRFNQLTNNATVDLDGLQYLKMPQLQFDDVQLRTFTVLWHGYPVNPLWLEFSDVDPGQFQPSFLPLPTSLLLFQCTHCGMTSVPDFSGTNMNFSKVDLSGGPIIVPPSVTSISLNDCNLSEPPALNNLTFLTISNNPLTSWGSLPGGLEELHATNVGLTTPPPITSSSLLDLSLADNGLTSFPDPPPTLQYVHLEENNLTSLPSLAGSGLQHLYLDNNPLTVLPGLPPGLRTLQIGQTLVSSLPTDLPPALINLQLEGTPITALPTLPNTLQYLYIDTTAIAALPELPPDLHYLTARAASALTCLPTLPQDLLSLQINGSGVTCLPNIPPNANLGLAFPAVVCDITNPCPLSDPLITGVTFNDTNSNGVQDGGETARPQALVIAQPGDLITSSDNNGDYVLPADIGAFTISGVPQLYLPVSTAPYAVSFTGSGEVDSLNHIGYVPIPGMFDLVTHLFAGETRPGFNVELWVLVNNVGTEPTSAQVQLLFDPALTWVSSDIVPASLNGNVADWNTPMIEPGASWKVHVTLYAAPTLPLGTPLVHQATATPQQADETLVDNSYVLSDVVVGSYDPNDKRVTPTSLTPEQVLANTRVHYVVRFQNTGTFPAERVLITDTLSADLQIASIQFAGSSHACHWYIRHGVLHVVFNNINLPDSASDEPDSHGFAAFSFVPTADLQAGEAVSNTANIYFDYNEAVITNAAVFTVEIPERVRSANNDAIIGPNPATNTLFVKTTEALRGAVEIIDLSGRILMTVPASGTRCDVDVATLATGSYLVRYVAGDRTYTTRFVKH